MQKLLKKRVNNEFDDIRTVVYLFDIFRYKNFRNILHIYIMSAKHYIYLYLSKSLNNNIYATIQTCHTHNLLSDRWMDLFGCIIERLHTSKENEEERILSIIYRSFWLILHYLQMNLIWVCLCFLIWQISLKMLYFVSFSKINRFPFSNYYNRLSILNDSFTFCLNLNHILIHSHIYSSSYFYCCK